MPLEAQCFGHHFIVGLSSTTLDSAEAELLAELAPAGIILFKHNIDQTPGSDWPAELLRLIEAAKSASGRTDFFVSIDHEGGRVDRLRPPATHFPAASHWGTRASDVAEAQAKELRALGVNLDFAPCLDTLLEPSNRVIGDRAFSSEAQTVADIGLKVYSAFLKHGLVPCGKHFPGHGGTVADSHVELPKYDAPLAAMLSGELLPFRAFIDAGAPLMMIAHILYPAIDPLLPATISRAVIAGLLRETLGFSGVVISDALDMGAVAHLAAGDIAVNFLNASGDIFLVCQPKNRIPAAQALDMAQALGRGLETGDLTRDTLAASAQRITSLVSFARSITPRATYPLELLGCPEHITLARSLIDPATNQN